MKIVNRFILLIAFSVAIASCKGKSAAEGTKDKVGTSADSVINDPFKNVQEALKRDSLDIVNKTNTDDILKHIDEYLVSKVTFQPAGSEGGITNGIITLQNNLPDVSFQKVLLEVSILTENDQEYRTDYYTFMNIEPGETKMTKMPKSSRGSKVISRVVKLKSEELTKGEMILIGKKNISQ